MMPSRRPLTSIAAALLAAACGCAALSAHAQLRIEITSGVTDPIHIAVVPFAGGVPAVPTAGADAATIVQNDLEGTGRFRAMPWSEMKAKPSAASQVVIPDWRASGNDYVVVGAVSALPDSELAVDFELLNTLTGEQLASQRFTGAPSALRNAAHRISNVIYEKILGVRGAFDTRIAYISVEGKPPAQHFGLVVADADGANAHVVLQSDAPIMSPAWSPDGTWLAYVSFENKRSTVYVQQVSTGQRQLVSARAGINGAPSWSPDGRKLALTLGGTDGNLDVYVLDLRTQQLTRLTDDPAIDTEAVWAPDGQSVYFTSDRGGGPQIYQIGVSGVDRPRRITFEGSYNAHPSLSPDGTQLAMVTEDGSSFRIAVQDLASGTVRDLSPGPLDNAPTFAPNGAMLLYASIADGQSVLQRASLDGLTSQRLTSDQADVRDPVWGPFAHP